MTLNDLINDDNPLIEERVYYIFSAFKKHYENVCYSERKTILGIGEPDKYLLCYIKKVDGCVQVRFKASKDSISITSSIEIIDKLIAETIKLFKANDYTRKSEKTNINILTERADNIADLVKSVIDTKGDVLISNVASLRLENALRKCKIYKIADLANHSETELKKIPYFGKACYEELVDILLSLKKESLGDGEHFIDELFLKSTGTKIVLYENKEEVVSYLESINYDFNRFEEGSLGWAICLKNKLKNNAAKVSFCNDEFELRELYIKNQDKYLELLNKTKEIIVDLINKTTLRERYTNMLLKLLAFDEERRTLQEVGDMFDITRERVRQIYNKLIKRLSICFRVYSVNGLMNRDAFNNYLLNFSSIPLDCFMLYLKAEKNDYIYKLFESLVLNFIEIPSDIEQKLDKALKILHKKQPMPTHTIPVRDVIETIIQGIEEICKVNYFGISLITRVLKGDNDSKVLNFELNKLKTYGALKNVKRTDIINIINYLIDNKVLYRRGTLRPVVKISLDTNFEERNNLDLSKLKRILSDNNEIKTTRMVENGADDIVAKTIKVKNFDVFVDENGELLTDIELLKRLQVLRKKIGDEKDIPYYCVAWDRVLVQLATKKPTTREEFLSIKGIRVRWFDNNGQAFLQEINDYLENQ